VSEPLPPGSDERDRARREFDEAWGSGRNRALLDRQRQLAGTAAALGVPDEDAVSRQVARAHAAAAKRYAWGPADEKQVLAVMEADRDRARRAAAEEAEATASFLAGLPFKASLLNTVG
jgi:hypothetical protein